MTAAESIFQYLKENAKNYKKGIFVTIVCSAIIAFSNFGFKNASLPKEEGQINIVQSGIKNLNSKDSINSIKIIVLDFDDSLASLWFLDLLARSGQESVWWPLPFVVPAFLARLGGIRLPDQGLKRDIPRSSRRKSLAFMR